MSDEKTIDYKAESAPPVSCSKVEYATTKLIMSANRAPFQKRLLELVVGND